MIILIEDILRSLSYDLDIDDQDLEYMVQRTNAESISFLTITLPAFSKALLVGLETGYFPILHPSLTSFKKVYGMPIFLRKYTKQVFTKSGRLLESPDPVSILVIRQLCDYFYKLALDFSENELSRAETSFCEVDDSIPSSIEAASFKSLRAWILNHFPSLRVTLTHVFKQTRPRFGPGTFSATGMVNDASHLPFYRVKNSTVASCVPDKLNAYSGFFKSYPASPERITTFKSDVSAKSELLFVPKDSRGPRTIVREPFDNIRMQMATHDFMRGALEKDTNYRVNFIDQTKNQILAHRASLDGTFATLDLKEASDRVSFALVKNLFGGFPCLREAFKLSRTREVTLPSGSSRQLNKLSGMGSGFTFPIMAALIYSAICHHVEAKTATDITSHVFVYGDDVIVPTRYADLAKQALSQVFLSVNEQKCFTSVRPAGNISRAVFRESCGGDFFGGNNVTPIRLKLANAKPYILNDSACLTVAKQDAGLLQLERHCRELVDAGYLSLANMYYKVIEQQLGTLPSVESGSPALGKQVRVVEDNVDKFGNFVDVEVFLPCSVEEACKEQSPYRYLAGKLNTADRYQLKPIVDYYDGLSVSSAYGRITIPRKVTLKRVVRPQNVLMGT